MVLQPSIDDLDALLAELTEVRDRLVDARDSGQADDTLWDAEVLLRHASERARRRADMLRRTIQLSRTG